jgi:ABC-type antimicrobial peptide transport system permease subunit
MEYYVWLTEGGLTTRTAAFQLAGVVPISGPAADPNLAPDYPGITESDRLSDWDPPFPIDLDRVRPKDEDYWKKYRTTPKAFIRLQTGQQLWESRYGNLTSLRFFPSSGVVLSSAAETFRNQLRDSIDPIQMGLSAYSVREQGLAASKGATDFGEYFVYFSFFLVVSALLLTALFFKLGVEQRSREIGLLGAIGFSSSKIRNLFLIEGAVLSTVGGVLGVVGAVGYGGLMMIGLRTWWVDAVGTTALSLHVSSASLLFGFLGGIATAVICVALTLRQLGHQSSRSLVVGSTNWAGSKDSGAAWIKRKRFRLIIATALILVTAGLLLGTSSGLVGQVAGFFGAGGSLLLALLTIQSTVLQSGRRQTIEKRGIWPVSRLGFRNATTRPGRSVLCIALFAGATFVIVAVDAFRRDSTPHTDKKSGTGGYPLLAESLLPISHNPNTTEGREALNIYAAAEEKIGDVTFSRFRVRPGDDASCLNLYQPRNPRIIAPGAEFVAEGRFSFTDSLATTLSEKENPWLLLQEELEDGVVPAIADANSITYVLHLKLGDEVIISGESGRPIRLKLVAALSDSVFQGELLISERNFLRYFPEQPGYRFFLIEAPRGNLTEVAATLEEQLSDFGVDVVFTSERLASFHRVENTYLSTFQTLGGLGLILGTLGLATIILRNVLERRRELALLRAIGYGRGDFRVIVLAENSLLLLAGLVTGALSALLAIAPAFATRDGRLPGVSLALLLIVVLFSGLIASVVATAIALRSPLLSALRSE